MATVAVQTGLLKVGSSVFPLHAQSSMNGGKFRGSWESSQNLQEKLGITLSAALNSFEENIFEAAFLCPTV